MDDRCAAPPSLPIEQPTHIELVVNLRAARAIALDQQCRMRATVRRRGDQMMQRRRILSLVAVGAWPARAQRAQWPRRFAYSSVRPGPNEFEQSFLRGLRELKHSEGVDFVVDFHWGNLDLPRHHANITEAMASRPDVVV